MRVFTMTILPILIISMVGVSFGQDLSNYYTPYGFRLPHLESGDYSVFLGTTYNKSLTKTEYSSTTLKPESEYKNLNITVNGLYAITEKFLVKASLYYYPSITRSKYEYFLIDPFGPDLLSGSEDELNGYIQHGALFVFRPKSKIELFIDYSMYSSTIDRISNTESPTAYTTKSQNDYYLFSAGINIIGKL